MSKYQTLWEAIGRDGRTRFTLSFTQIEALAGLPMDHSLLNAKKELLAYGYQVGKISLREQTVAFEKIVSE